MMVKASGSDLLGAGSQPALHSCPIRSPGSLPILGPRTPSVTSGWGLRGEQGLQVRFLLMAHVHHKFFMTPSEAPLLLMGKRNSSRMFSQHVDAQKRYYNSMGLPDHIEKHSLFCKRLPHCLQSAFHQQQARVAPSPRWQFVLLVFWTLVVIKYFAMCHCSIVISVMTRVVEHLFICPFAIVSLLC